MLKGKMQVLLVVVLLIAALFAVSAFAISQNYVLADGPGMLSQFLTLDGGSMQGSCVPSAGCIAGT